MLRRMQESRHRPLLVVGLMLVLIAAGSVVLQREVAETMTQALLLSVAWAGIVGLGFLLYASPRGMLPQVIAGLAVGAVIAGGSYYWFSVRDEEVDEDVVTAAKTAEGAEAEQGLASAEASGGARKQAGNTTLASGSFMGEDGHDGSGTATVVQEPGGGRVLTFTDFDVDPGAQVEVWLTTGPDQTGDRVELGSLKGNVGNQQYEIPADADLNRHGTVMLYCTPFTVRIAVAELMSA